MQNIEGIEISKILVNAIYGSCLLPLAAHIFLNDSQIKCKLFKIILWEKCHYCQDE